MYWKFKQTSKFKLKNYVGCYPVNKEKQMLCKHGNTFWHYDIYINITPFIHSLLYLMRVAYTHTHFIHTL